MARYIKSFENDAAIQSAVDNGVLSKPYVAYDESANTIDWNSKINRRKIPLTFEIISDGVINYKKNSSGSFKSIQYSSDNGDNWTTISQDSSLNVFSGDVIIFKGDNTQYAASTFSGTTCGFKISGNIMSLINSTDFEYLNSFSVGSVFNQLFNGCTGLTDAGGLILPATALTQSCYDGMFAGCTSLTTAPEISPLSFATFACSGMFKDCINLKYVKSMSPVKPSTNQVYYWMQGVSSTGTFVKASGVNWSRGDSGIPNNWTVIDA